MKLIPKKSLGQHFLNSKSALNKIIVAAEIHPDENILEIGPGTGILTQELLFAGAKVIAVEKDQRAIMPLVEKFKADVEAGRLKLINDDVLQVRKRGMPPLDYAVVANIPYYITGAILESFLEREPRPRRMVLLIQKEVAERIVARDGKESLLSVSVKAFGQPKIVAKVPRGAFTPPPEVDSAVILIKNISSKRFLDKNINISRFFEVVRAGFAHKRKILIRNLEVITDHDQLKSVWRELNLNLKVRAEDLTVDQWFQIAAELKN